TTTEAPSAASALAMPAPMPFDAPVTTATLPLSLLMTHPEFGKWGTGSLVPWFATYELMAVVQGLVRSRYASVYPSRHGKHHLGRHSSCAVGPRAHGDLRLPVERRGGAILREFPEDQRSHGAQVHAFATFPGVARCRADPQRAARRGDAQHPPAGRDRQALPGPAGCGDRRLLPAIRQRRCPRQARRACAGLSFPAIETHAWLAGTCV